MKHLFIDTNIFLHFQFFDSIDWLKELGCEECTLVIAPVVIDELDKRKVSNDKFSKKARKVLQKIEELSESNLGLSENIHFKIIMRKPTQTFFEDHGLEHSEQDQRLLASIIEYKTRENLDRVFICTNDVGPRLRAKEYGIESFVLDAKYKLSEEQSEDEKELQRLRMEFAKLKVQTPQLLLEFPNEKNFLEIVKKPEFELEHQEYINKVLRDTKMEYPEISIDPYQNPAAMIFGLTSGQISSYNNKLARFYENVRKWAIDDFDYQRIKHLSYVIGLNVKNVGSVPANNIDIHLHFPDGFELVELTGRQKKKKRPEPPYKPKHQFDYGPSSIISPIAPFNTTNILDKFDSDRPKIKKTNSYDVDFYKSKLKHGYSEPLDKLILTYSSFNEIKNFSIEYIISADNVSEKVEGKLNVVFKDA